jgi:hypothetical protein
MLRLGDKDDVAKCSKLFLEITSVVKGRLLVIVRSIGKLVGVFIAEAVIDIIK